MAVSLPRQNYDIINREKNGRTSFEFDGISSKSETLKRSLAKDDLANEGPGMKDKNESDNEPDGEPAAKIRRGGGRRKQSKPMRMFADIEAVSDSDPSRQILDQMPMDSAAHDGRKGMTFSAAVLPMGAFVCQLCHENFQTEGALKEHVYQVHTMVYGDEIGKDSVCPTKYHVLGNELKQEASFETDTKEEEKEVAGFSENSASAAADEDSNGRCDWLPVSKEEDIANSGDDLLKSEEQGHNTVGKVQADQFLGKLFASGGDESQSSSSISHGSKVEKPYGSNGGKQSADFGASVTTFDPVVQNDVHSQVAAAAASSSLDPAKSRIFHPDAYCEICDREFCNKYFLKTHKANKHGIYDNITGLESSASGNTDLFFGMLQQQHQQPCSATPPKASPPKPCGDLNSGLHTGPLLSVSGVVNIAEESSSIPTIKSSSTEADDYCDICQKHFVSKHQLKKHKQESHGFQTQADKRSAVAGLPVGSPNSMSLNASVDNAPTSHSLLLPHLATTTNSVPSALSDFSRMANFSNLMFLNPFNSPLAVIPPLFPTPSLGFRPSSLTIPQLPLQDVQKSVNASRFPSDSSSLPGNLLQSMGVLNAETLMELYRKEFCNSYLMRSQEANSSRSGLFSGSMTGFQSGIPTNMNFSLPGKTVNQDSAISSEPLLLKQEKHDMDGVGGGGDVCEICKKTFISKSALVSHLLTVHNIKQESCDLASELMKLDKLNEDHHFEKAMFGNMVAAKLVDRVQCDICNKEVCNKYFLKTHKIKVHGWDPAYGERELQDKNFIKQTSPSQTQNIAPDTPPTEMVSVEKPKEEELLQMGIDPEAYCEICKKEFCNKYFLKTHKQNIHGIKTANNPLESRTNPIETWNFSQAPPSQTNPMTTAQLSLLAGTQQLQPLVSALNPPPSLMSVLESGVHDGSAEKRSWKWKEPVNAMRVTCEICNKVLCNKYFLKTHMMKRHGVNYDTITGQLMSTIKCNPDYGLARGEETHLGSDELLASQVMLMQSIDKQVSSSSRSIARHASGVLEQNLNLMEKSVESENEGSAAGRMSGNLQPDGDKCAALRNEAESRASSAMNLVLSETSKALDLTSNATTVMAKTWHVPSEGHDVDDDHKTNNESVVCEADTEASNDIYLQKGPEGDAVVGDREDSKFYSSRGVILDEIHGASEGSSPMSSSVEEKKDATENTALDINKFEGTSVETAKTAIANHIRSQQKKRMFRCTHCRERFQSRSHCELHIHTSHPRLEGSIVMGHQADIALHSGPDGTGKKLSNSINEAPASTNSLGYLNGYAQAKQLTFSSENGERKDSIATSDVLSKQQQHAIYAQPIDQTNLSNILMQPFLLKEVGGENHFASSLVYLPALQKINEPLSVTFSLTPILQH